MTSLLMLAQAPDYSYHMPLYLKFKLGMAALLGLIAAIKATSSKTSSARSAPSTPLRAQRFPTSASTNSGAGIVGAVSAPPRPAEPGNQTTNMNILVSRNGQQLGPYALDEINRHLSAGDFAPTDFAWHEGMADWQPLTSIPGVMLSQPLRGPPPPAAPLYSGVAAPAAPSTGLLIGGYLCAAVSLLFIPPFLGLAGIICGVIVIKRQQVNQGVTLLIVSFICAAIGMMIGAASQ